ncbi:MAG TPA: NAD-dependent epimerase/dehydratase family protein [Acidimicrobiia bacterium]|nr:NAD-dependent epimerase/dehydratase family protein [Acidimicrobiia bacterium]
MRVLVTGLGTYWGGSLAQALEQLDDVEMIVGLDTEEPTVPLERTEFVRADTSYSILSRIVRATQVDTILHTHLIVDTRNASSRELHEINVIGTMNLLAAAGASNSPVRKVIVKSSTLVYGSSYQNPTFFREEMPRARSPRTRVERSLIEVEDYLRDFAEDNPHVVVSLLRFSNVLGERLDTPLSRALRMPAVPEIFGFDPRLQFTHHEDVLGACLFAARHDVPGIYNVAADGLLPWSEVCTILGKPRLPLPPVGTGLVAGSLARLGLVQLPREALELLRYGRGVDNRRFKRAGFRYHYTSAGAVEAFAEALRLERSIGDARPAYRYERDVENFFRHSPAVIRSGDA